MSVYVSRSHLIMLDMTGNKKEKESEKNTSANITQGDAYLPVYPSFVLLIHALFQLSSQARQVKLEKWEEGSHIGQVCLYCCVSVGAHSPALDERLVCSQHSTAGSVCEASGRPEDKTRVIGQEESQNLCSYLDTDMVGTPPHLFPQLFTLICMRLSKLQSTTSFSELDVTSLRGRFLTPWASPLSSSSWWWFCLWSRRCCFLSFRLCLERKKKTQDRYCTCGRRCNTMMKTPTL